jgi:hypothetical protein
MAGSAVWMRSPVGIERVAKTARPTESVRETRMGGGFGGEVVENVNAKRPNGCLRNRERRRSGSFILCSIFLLHPMPLFYSLQFHHIGFKRE